MHLFHLFLPIYDNEGSKLSESLFREVRDELPERFGGITTYSRAPAEGLWKQDDSKASRDELIIYEVMVERFERAWWTKYRESLDRRFRQEKVLVRAQEIEVL